MCACRVRVCVCARACVCSGCIVCVPFVCVCASACACRVCGCRVWLCSSVSVCDLVFVVCVCVTFFSSYPIDLWPGGVKGYGLIFNPKG